MLKLVLWNYDASFMKVMELSYIIMAAVIPLSLPQINREY